jgi:pectate lyase
MQHTRRLEVGGRRPAGLGGRRTATVVAPAVLLLAVLLPARPVHARAPLGSPQGFGAGTTGGNGAPRVFVTSLADSGPGTLRDAVERPEPAEVRFRVAGTISLQTHLHVGPNKTIDGRGSYPVTITNRGLILAEPNVIVESLRFNRFGDPTVPDDPQDAIDIRGARRVWITHNRFSNAADKAIQVTSGTEITVSGNHFRRQSQVFQVGCYTCPDGDAIRLSVHDNHFAGGDRGYRMPTINYGYVHAWNNYLVDWAYFGMASSRVGRLLIQGNVFEAGESKRAAIHHSATPDDKDPRDGYLRSVDDILLNGALIDENEPGHVADPPYAAAVRPASASLADSIAAAAGPRPA